MTQNNNKKAQDPFKFKLIRVDTFFFPLEDRLVSIYLAFTCMPCYIYRKRLRSSAVVSPVLRLTSIERYQLPLLIPDEFRYDCNDDDYWGRGLGERKGEG